MLDPNASDSNAQAAHAAARAARARGGQAAPRRGNGEGAPDAVERARLLVLRHVAEVLALEEGEPLTAEVLAEHRDTLVVRLQVVRARAARLRDAELRARQLLADAIVRKESLGQLPAAAGTVEALEPQSRAVDSTRRELEDAERVAELDALEATRPALERAAESARRALEDAEREHLRATREAEAADRALRAEASREGELESLRLEVRRLEGLGSAVRDLERAHAAFAASSRRLEELASRCEKARRELDAVTSQVARCEATLGDALSGSTRWAELKAEADKACRLRDDVRRITELRTALRQAGGKEQTLALERGRAESALADARRRLAGRGAELAPGERHALEHEVAEGESRCAGLVAAQAEHDATLASVRNELLALGDALGAHAYADLARLEAAARRATDALRLATAGHDEISDLEAHVRTLRSREVPLGAELAESEKALHATMAGHQELSARLTECQRRVGSGLHATRDLEDELARLRGAVEGLQERRHAAEAEAGRTREGLARTAATLEAARGAADAASRGAQEAREKVEGILRRGGLETPEARQAARRSPEEIVRLQVEVTRFDRVLEGARERSRRGADAASLPWPDVKQVESLLAVVSDALAALVAEETQALPRVQLVEQALAELESLS